MYNTTRLLAHAAHSRVAFDRVNALGLNKSFTPDVQEVWKRYTTYYERDTAANSLDYDAIFDALCDQFPRYEDNYNRLREQVASYPLSESNFLEDLRDQLRSAVGLEIVNAIGTRRPWEDIRELFDKVDEETVEDEGLLVYNNANISDIVEATAPSQLTQLAPPILNDYIGGGVPSPCHILVFARPDMGKTSFMLNLVKGFCRQGKKVLYYGNEDNPQSFLMRSFTVFTGQPKDVVREHQDRVQASLDRQNYGLLDYVASEAGTMAQISALCSKYEPDVLVIDQLRNLTVKQDSRQLELEHLAREARILSRHHELIVISVSQAGSEAEGKSYLGLNDLDYSKTGVQGAVDLMVGLGASEADAQAGYRCVSLPKNKFDQHRFGPKLQFNPATGIYE